MKITKTKKTTVLETFRYWLTDEIKYVKLFENDKHTRSFLEYSGKKHRGVKLHVIYLKERLTSKLIKDMKGPHQTIIDILRDKLPEDPKKVQLSRLYLYNPYNYTILQKNKKRLPQRYTTNISIYSNNGYATINKKLLNKLRKLKIVSDVRTKVMADEGCCYYIIEHYPTENMLLAAEKIRVPVGMYLFTGAAIPKRTVGVKLLRQIDPFNLRKYIFPNE